jgi:hypothetical protein
VYPQDWSNDYKNTVSIIGVFVYSIFAAYDAEESTVYIQSALFMTIMPILVYFMFFMNAVNRNY